MAETKNPHRNSITDVGGLLVGNAEDEEVCTGVTVILPEKPMVAAVDVRGGGPGARETDLLDPSRLVSEVNAIVLAGGSVYGLEAASAVTTWLGERRRGFGLIPGAPVSPIVPAAILYDLANGGDKGWGAAPPYAALGRAACEKASKDVVLGNTGAGYGAKAGALKGGLGTASAITKDGWRVGALIAVNSFGSVLMPGTDVFWAWAWEQAGEFGGARPPADWPGGAADLPPDTKLGAPAGANTTIGVVAVNAALTPAETKHLAVMAQDGLARAIRPVHAPTDGDILFALASGDKDAGAAPARTLALTRLGALAADCTARAIARAVYAAESLGGMPSYAEKRTGEN